MKKILDSNYSDYEKIINVNFFSFLIITNFYLKYSFFRTNFFPNVIFISSIASFLKIGYSLNYNFSKNLGNKFLKIFKKKFEIIYKNSSFVKIDVGPTLTQSYCKNKDFIRKDNFFEIFPNEVAYSILYQGGLDKLGGHPYHEILRIFFKILPEFFYNWILKKKMISYLDN